MSATGAVPASGRNRLQTFHGKVKRVPRYVIERDLPGAGSLSDDEIRAISAKSNQVLADMGGQVQWDHSYVTGEKLFCVYVAPDEGKVQEHAAAGGFPADAVHRVVRVIDPTTGGR